MNHRLLIATAVLAVFLVAALPACGDGDRNGSPGPATTRADGNGPSPGGGNGDATLQDLAQRFVDGVAGKIVYRYKSNFGNPKPDGVWTDYRLDGKTRRDWEDKASEFGYTTLAIINGDQGYICTAIPGSADCSNKTVDEVRNIFPFFIPVTHVPEAIAKGIDGLAVKELPNETIGGATGRCFDLDVPDRIEVAPGTEQAGTEKIKICFSEEGALLLMNRTVNFTDTSIPPGQLDITAEAVGEATPADFEPPASPRG